MDGASGSVLEGSSCSCIISNCYAENCINMYGLTTSSFAHIDANSATDKVVFRQNSLINSGRAVVVPDDPSFDSFSGNGNYIARGSVTIEIFNFTKCSGYRGSAIYFSSLTSEQATISMCTFIECYATKDSQLSDVSATIIYYGENGRNFETKQCNFIECTANRLLYVYAHVFIEECSFTTTTSQNFSYISTRQHQNDISLSISQSYIDTLYSTPSGITNSESRTLFTNLIPTFDFNVFITPRNTKYIQRKIPYYIHNVPKKYQILF